MKYVVGGAVRDVLIGNDPKDIDFVWTNTTEQKLLKRGFKRVAEAFPVFLDVHGNEHALARTESKTKPGYHGFDVLTEGVSIEQDLFRRDLTMNAMAVRHKDWKRFCKTKDTTLVIDPYGGIKHLQKGIIRHVSDFFADDGVRALRAARFAARYGFEVHEDTYKLFTQLKEQGEFDALVAERVWSELERALMEDRPDIFFEVLLKANIFSTIIPESQTQRLRFSLLRHSALLNMPLEIRLKVSGFSSKQVQLLKGPKDAINFCKRFEAFEEANGVLLPRFLTTTKVVDLFKRFDILHADSKQGSLLHSYMMFRAVTDNDPTYYQAMDPQLLTEMRGVKLPKDTDIEPRERNEVLWRERTAVVNKYLKYC